MADKTPLKLVDLGSGQGSIKEFQTGDTIPGSLVPSKANSGANGDITSLTGLTTPLSRPQGGIGGALGYIEGLTMVWGSVTSVTISAGSAYVPSVGTVVTYAGGTITPSGAANAFIHLYLTSAGAIEQSATAPAYYYNQAQQKTGDNTRRYIGSMLVSATVNQVYKFHHHPQPGSLMYTHGNPVAAPFQILGGGTTGAFTTAPSCPVSAHSLVGTFQTTGTGIAQFTPSDAGTSVTVGWEVFVSQGIATNAICRIAPDRTITGYASGSNLLYVYTTGYLFDR